MVKVRLAICLCALGTLSACGGDSRPSGVALQVAPNPVEAGSHIAVTVVPALSGKTSTETVSRLDQQNGSSWAPLYYLESSGGQPSDVVRAGPTVVPLGDALDAGTTERVAVPRRLAAGQYRLVKQVIISGGQPFEVAAPLEVQPVAHG
jgi:hypothetical protein